MILQMEGSKAKAGHVILAGDVGATKTALAIFEWNGNHLQVRKKATCRSKAYPDIQSLLNDFLTGEKLPQTICLGVAGPVQNGRANLTNLGWQIDSSMLSGQFQNIPVLLINDLQATATSFALLEENDVFVLHEGEKFSTGNAAIIAPGTGLGEAGLFFDGHNFHPFASEGGHCDFVPRTDFDLELFLHLRKRYGHVSQERVISGPGICLIYDFLHHQKELEEPAWLKEKMLAHDKATVITQNATESALCKETVSHFLRYFAVESSALALKLKATGGLFIAGGIVPHLLPVLDRDVFLKFFSSVGRLKNLLKEVPVKIILNEKAPLLGAAWYGLHSSSSALQRKSRRAAVE